MQKYSYVSVLSNFNKFIFNKKDIKMNIKLITTTLITLPLLIVSNMSFGQINQGQLAKPNQDVEVIEVNPNNFLNRTRLKKQLIKGLMKS